MTGIAAAHGAPGQLPAVAGVDGGVGYSTSIAADRSSATVELTAGTFEITPEDGVAVLRADGSRVGPIPMTVAAVNGPDVRVAPELDASGTSPVLRPVGTVTPGPVAPADIDQTGNIIAGAAIGCVVGALIGLIFLIVPAIPGCIIGAIIGGVIGSNQS